MREPIITINGQLLPNSASMTVRVAIEAFAIDLSKPDALGEDEIGREIAKNYKKNIDLIRSTIFLNQ